jgi:nucleoside diphosphate kinase
MNTQTPKNKYALFVAKPDAVRDFLDVTLTSGLEDRGLDIVKRRLVTFTPDQAQKLYAEKEEYNYFPLLVDFMSSGPSLCLILRCSEGGDAVSEAKGYRDWARHNLKRQKFELSKEDLVQLNEGKHPKQTDITREMALENLIHVSDDFCAQTPVLGEIFNQWDLAELKDREPELHSILVEAKREAETQREVMLYHPAPERF